MNELRFQLNCEQYIWKTRGPEYTAFTLCAIFSKLHLTELVYIVHGGFICSSYNPAHMRLTKTVNNDPLK